MCVYIYLYIYINVYIYLFVCIYMFIYTYTYVYIYIQIHSKDDADLHEIQAFGLNQGNLKTIYIYMPVYIYLYVYIHTLKMMLELMKYKFSESIKSNMVFTLGCHYSGIFSKVKRDVPTWIGTQKR